MTLRPVPGSSQTGMIISEQNGAITVGARQAIDGPSNRPAGASEANAHLFDRLWSAQIPGSRRTFPTAQPEWLVTDEFRCVPPAPPAQSLQAK